MKIEILIEANNAAFEGRYGGSEAARILGQCAEKLNGRRLTAGEEFPLFDINGNRVGKMEVTDEE